jgi:hypothetical protein
VPAPRLNYPRYPDHLEKWQRFEFQIRRLPAAKQITNWCQTLRTEWWTRFAVHRFLADAAADVIVGYDPGAYEVPSTYWESDIDFDPQRGDLYCRHDGRLPLRRALRFYAEGDAPALAVERAARQIGDVKEALPVSERVAILAELLPFPASTVRSVVYRALAGRRRLELVACRQPSAGELDHLPVITRSL